MRSAPDEIRAAVVAAGGAIPFERFMELALYGESGFYTGAAGTGPADVRGAGRRGDFLTSPEVGPLFGALVARLLDREWERTGRPDPFHLVDVGAGPGTLARSVAVAEPACAPALRVVAVDVSPSQRAAHPADVQSVASFDEAAGGERFDGVVIANELLDNVPFALAVHDGAWREAYVTNGPGGGEAPGSPPFVEVLSAPFDPVPDVLPDGPAHGARAPLQRRAGALVESVLARIGGGSLHAFDYCRPTTADVARLPWREWLRTYRAHGRGGHYLEQPGTVDITCDVVVDQLPPPDRRVAQASFLTELGIELLVDEGRRRWSESAAAPTLEAMRMRSRIREAEALLDPAGLGGFCALSWWR